MNHTTTRITALTAIMLCISALAGCGGTTRFTQDGTDAECSSLGMGGFLTCTVTMPDTRRVTCIAYRTNSGGISCDWAHADGADKGWTE